MNLRTIRIPTLSQFRARHRRRRLLFESLENRNLLAPVAFGDNYNVTEDAALVVGAAGVLANDTGAISAILVAGPANGTIILNANGGFTYTPAVNYAGVDQFSYRASDGVDTSSPAIVTIVVAAINDAPMAVNDTFTTLANQALSRAAPGVLANDIDVEGNPLTTIIATGPANGSLAMNANGSFLYTPNNSVAGIDSFTYRASDGSASSNTATVTISVVGAPANFAPVAVNDTFAAAKNTPLNVPAPGLLGNDTDANSDPLTTMLVSGTANGTLALNANGSFTFAPALDFAGAVSFTYRASDGALSSNVATVTITVAGTPANVAPVAVNDSFTTPQNTPLIVQGPGVLANDSDPNGDLVTAIVNAGPASGTLVMNANGSFTYTPSDNFSGNDSFSYRVSDGALTSNIVTVTINVQAASSGQRFVTAAGGGLANPVGLAFGPGGQLFVANQGSNNVRRFDASGAALGTFIDSGVGGLSETHRVVFGPDGNLYVSSGNADTIVRYNGTTGALLGTFVTAGSGGLDRPIGIVFSGSGLYVANAGNNSISKFDANTGAFVSTFVAPGSGGLSQPTDLVFGPDGNLYVSSWVNDRVLRYNGTTGAFIDAFVQPGSGGLDAPNGLAFGPDGSLYVGGFFNSNVVRRFNGSTGAFHSTVSATGLQQPVGMTFGPDGRLYVSSFGTNEVFRLDVSMPGTPTGPIPAPPGLVAWWTGDGTGADSAGTNHGIAEGGANFAAGKVGQAFSLDGIDDRIRVPNSAVLNPAAGFTIEAWIKSNSNDGPRAIVSKWNDNTNDWSYIFKDHNFSDKLRIELSKAISRDLADLSGGTSIATGQWVHVAMTYDTSAVRLYFNGALDGAQPVAPGQLIDSSLTDLLIGAVYTEGGIHENFSGLIDEVSLYNRALTTNEIQSISAAGSSGKTKFVAPSGGSLDGPVGLAIGADGNLYVSSNHSNSILRYDGTTGVFQNVFSTGGGLQAPHGLTFGPDGHLYVASAGSNSILRFDKTTGALLSTFVGAGSGGMAFPYDLLFGHDSTGDGVAELYVSSRDTDQVLRYNGQTGAFLNVFAAGGGLDQPLGLTLGPGSDLFVSGQSSNNVLRFSGATGALIGPFVAPGSGTLSEPHHLRFGPDVTSDGIGELYVASGGNSKVLRYNGSTGAFVDTFVTAASGGLDRPTGLLVRPDGKLLVSSLHNDRVAVFDATTIVPNSAPVATNDTFAGTKNTPLSITAPGVLANDSDANGDPLTATLVSGPAYGTLSLGTGGGFVYTPASNYTGPDNFTYTVKDPREAVSNVATVAISIAQPIAASGLIGWWSGDGTASDFSGQSNHGILEGGATFAPGVVGQAFSLDGIDDRIRVPHSAVLNPSGGFTIEAWIKSNSTDGPRNIVSKWNDNTSDWSYIFKDHNGSDKLRAELSKSAHNDLADLAGNTSLAMGQWTHVAMTYDTSHVRLYYNGVLDGSQAVDPTRLIDRSTADLLIGAVFTGGGVGENFSGLIDEVSLYSRALSGAELQTIASAGAAGKQKPLAVNSSTPASGAVVTTPLTEFSVRLTVPYDVVSVQAGDLTVNGIPATSFVALDANTIAFQYATSPIVAAGSQSLQIEAGAISSSTAGGGSTALQPYSISFQYVDLSQAIPAPSGLIGWWTGDGTGADFTGNRDGILEGDAGFAPGMVGQAFSLDGIDDRIRVPSSAALNPAAGFTIEAWIKSNGTSGPRIIASKWNDNTSDWSYIFKDHNDSDKLRIELSKDNFHDLADLSGSTSIATGQWIHVAMTYDTSTVRLYYNGALDGSQAVDPTRFIDQSAADLLIGAVYTGGGISEFFAGLIDEVSLYSRALQGAEIQAIAAASAVGKQKALLVTGSTPAAGATFALAPTEFTVAFSYPVRPDSVQASDLKVNGIPAASMTLINPTTVKFSYGTSPATNSGTQAMQIAAGAIAANVEGIARAELVAWSSNFVVGQVEQSYSISPSLKVAAERGSQRITAWLTDIVTGPDDQPLQSVRFLVGSDNPSLFSVPPAIDPTGRLTFTPTPNSKGIATVHVLLLPGVIGAEAESGGELDTTTSGTFTIEILQLYPLQNDRDWLDVSDDLHVSPIDAVLIIDYLNGFGGAAVPLDLYPEGPFIDTSGDNFISPIDAVLVINDLNADSDAAAAAEGEHVVPIAASGLTDQPELQPAGLQMPLESAAAIPASAPLPVQPNADDLIALLAYDVSQQAKRRRIDQAAFPTN